MGRLGDSFYQRPDGLAIAKELLGKRLVTEFDGVRTSGLIVETEAYMAPEDKASHAYGLRRTSRTETMFLAGGHAYVYLIYGIYRLFNVVTADENLPHAILIRAIQPDEGIDVMLLRRGLQQMETRLCAGPGLLTKALGIDLVHNSLSLTSAASNIFIEDTGVKWPESKIVKSPRVGIAYAGEWALKPWRFRIKDNKWTSSAK